MTTKTAPPTAPTEDEVLTALLRETVGETDIGAGRMRKSWSPASRIDVAERVARNRGWDGASGFAASPAGHTPTRASIIGKWVSIKAVEETLIRLYNDDRVHAFYGSHPFIAVAYGVSPRQTYYLSQDALDMMLSQRREMWRRTAEQSALEAAQAQVLAEHADDVAKYQEQYLAVQLTTEPDWQAMLNDGQEAGAN